MDFAYRLDVTLDLFEMTVAGASIVMSQDELRAAKEAIDQVHASWSRPKPEQIWAAVTQAPVRDPRR
jgi:hypothetical protein